MLLGGGAHEKRDKEEGYFSARHRGGDVMLETITPFVCGRVRH